MISVDLSKNLERQIEASVGKMTQDALAYINQRTVRGKDADEKSFVPYSDSYAAYRISKGRKAKPVDLLWTGGMLRSMQWKTEVTASKVLGIIYFADATEAQKARYLMDGIPRKDRSDNARNFFAFGEKLTKRLRRIFGESIDFTGANK